MVDKGGFRSLKVDQSQESKYSELFAQENSENLLGNLKTEIPPC